jgi:hypothetical protein
MFFRAGSSPPRAAVTNPINCEPTTVAAAAPAERFKKSRRVNDDEGDDEDAGDGDCEFDGIPFASVIFVFILI